MTLDDDDLRLMLACLRAAAKSTPVTPMTRYLVDKMDDLVLRIEQELTDRENGDV